MPPLDLRLLQFGVVLVSTSVRTGFFVLGQLAGEMRYCELVHHLSARRGRGEPMPSDSDSSTGRVPHRLIVEIISTYLCAGPSRHPDSKTTTRDSEAEVRAVLSRCTLCAESKLQVLLLALLKFLIDDRASQSAHWANKKRTHRWN